MWARILRAGGLVGLLAIALSGCGFGGSNGVDLSVYDQAEVDYLRSQIPEDANVSDEVMVSTLEFRENCRRLQAYVNMRTRGEEDPEIIERFTEVPQRVSDGGQVYMVDVMTDLVVSAEVGDLAAVVDFLSSNCRSDPGSPGGVDSVE